MKKNYILFFEAFAFVVTAGAQTLLIDETFEGWDPTSSEGFADNVYGSWNYTSPNSGLFEVQTTRYKITNSYIDVEVDTKSTGPGAIILPEVANCSKIEIDYRSGSNTSETGNRFMYLSTYDGESFTKITPDYPAIGSEIFKDPSKAEFNAIDAKFQTVTITTEVASESPIRFAIRCNGKGAVRIENIRIWAAAGDGELTSIQTPAASGSVVSTEYFSINGIKMGSNFDVLPSGIYIQLEQYSDGSVDTKKIVKNIR
ncbi:MAG: hypothetical protein GXY94_03605 [Bacteroidales bacterium]|nr:hypothetical protein [Bacteroidales bacterium]